MKAFWRGVDRSSITFDINKSATRISFGLPCGRCIGCRLEKARQWGVRCLHEKKMHADSCYVTLTYNDECVPEGNTLVVRDLQLFMKRLRKSREPAKVRFFAGGEYGETNYRPHYHVLLFGCGFPDKLFHTNNKRGEPLFISKELQDLWGLGFCTIGDVTFDSAVYCAKYALKKVTGEAAYAHYNIIDEDGVVLQERIPEFALMSRRPGIGAGYYEKFGEEVRCHDNVIVNGLEVRPPRFYDTRSELLDGPLFDLNKRKRKRLAVLSKADNTAERLRVKEKLMILAAEKKERKL
nr:replication associated protein [Flumine microvirus 29]